MIQNGDARFLMPRLDRGQNRLKPIIFVNLAVPGAHHWRSLWFAVLAKHGHIATRGRVTAVLVCAIVHGKSYGKKFKLRVSIFRKGYFEMASFSSGETSFVAALTVQRLARGGWV